MNRPGLHVSWEDGPTVAAVPAITVTYQGRKFNSITDAYDDAGTALVAFFGDGLPREVRNSCDGITTHRDYTAAGFATAQKLISTDSDNESLVIFKVW